jgi:hypothetical protein
VGGRKPGQPNFVSTDIKTIIRKAAEEVGFIRRVPVKLAERIDLIGMTVGALRLLSGDLCEEAAELQ